MKTLLAILGLCLLAGCTINNRDTDIFLTAGTSMRIDAAGATNRTDTDQAAEGDFSGVLDKVAEYMKANASKIMEALEKGKDIVIPVVPAEEKFEPAAVSPAGQGEFEEIQ